MANVKIDHDYKLCVFDVKISCCWSEKHSRACAVDVSDDNDASGVLVSSSSSSRYIPGICRNGTKWVDYDFIILSSFYLFVFHKQQDLLFSTKQSYVAIHLRLVYQWMNPSASQIVLSGVPPNGCFSFLCVASFVFDSIDTRTQHTLCKVQCLCHFALSQHGAHMILGA